MGGIEVHSSNPAGRHPIGCIFYSII